MSFSDFLERHGLWIAAIFIITLCITAATSKKGDIEVNQIGSWKEAPLIVNCKGSPFSKEEVEEVANRWRDRGHEIFDVVETDCINDYVPGLIMIRAAGININGWEDGNAQTFRIEETQEIRGSIIEIFNDKLIILEHELGHALGYQHVQRKGHIMYPYTNHIGNNDEGLYRKELEVE